MAQYISILRGINVGGKRKILMSDLKLLFERLECSNIITYIQSGNVIFDYKQAIEINELEQKIEKEILNHYNFKVPVIIRTVDQLNDAISNNPFIKQSKTEQLHLTLLSDIPDNERLEKIFEYDFSPDKFKIIEKEVFILCANKYSDSKLTNGFFEKKLKVNATTRNWKTVNKLVELAEVSL